MMRNAFRLAIPLFILVCSFQNCSGGFQALQESESIASLSNTSPPTPPTPVLGLSVTTSSVIQGGVAPVSLSFNTLPNDGQIGFELLDGTALANQDYQPLKGSMQIAKGMTGAQLDVQSLRSSIASATKKLSIKVTLTVGSQTESTAVEIPITTTAVASKYKKIAVGDFSTCGITLDDKVRCWGGHESGGLMGLGDGNYSASLNSVEVKNLEHVKELSAGRYFACAITTKDTVACWGRGFEGQLGPGAPNNSRVPYELPGVTGLHGLSSGRLLSCALMANNNVFCWGIGGEHSYGGEVVSVLGAVKSVHLSQAQQCVINQDDSVSCWTDERIVNSVTRTVSKIAGLSNVKALAPPCAIDSQNHVYCWDNSTKTPTMVAGIEGAQDLTTGTRHACVTLADRSVKCWNLFNGPLKLLGQLGNGTTVASLTPVGVLGLANVRSISSQTDTTCANLNDDTVKCWGSNSNLQLGFNGVTGSSVPLDRPSVPNAKKIVSSPDHACAITSDAHLKCWGHNDFGQLGNNSTLDSTIPVDVTGLANVKDVAVGMSTTCAITTDNLAKCWGKNRLHELPNTNVGTAGTSLPADSGLGTVLSLALGDSYGCAVKSDGTIVCWFSNQLPTPVAGLSGQLSVTTANGLVCSLSSANAVACWGSNSIPSTVPLTGKIVSLSAGANEYHALKVCALDEQKNIQCWGSNLMPSLVATGATGLSVGDAFLCYGNSDGTVSILGFTPAGLTGNGTSDASRTVQVGFGGMKPRLYDCRGNRPILVQSTTERWLTAGVTSGFGYLSNSSSLVSYSNLPLTVFDPP